MTDYTYDPKNLPASNYPLRKFQALVRKTTPKFLRPLHDAVDKPILNTLEPLAEEYKQYKPQAGAPVPGSAEDAIKKAYEQNLNVARPPGMRKGGKVKKYASGGGIPKPPKGKKYDAAANDWMAGEMEAEAEKERKKAKPNKAADRDRPIDRFIPGVNYDNEFNTYVDHYNRKKGVYYTPRTQPGFTIKRNDQDLAAQSTVDYNMTGRRPKRQGGGPAQRGNINMASGGSVSSRADGCCTKGKTKGRFV